MKLEIKLLTEAEIDWLVPFLTALADYHNQVAVNFSGCYPLVSVSDKCVVLKNGLATGKSKAAVVLANGKGKAAAFFPKPENLEVSITFILMSSCAAMVQVLC